MDWQAKLAQPLLMFAETIDSEAIKTNWQKELAHPLLMAVVFTIIGVVLFTSCLWLIVKCAPFSIRKEIEEDQNVALGVIIGSMILGLAIILAAAIHG